MIRQSYLSAWQVAEEAFPRTGTPQEQLKFLVNYAVLAPSSHNSQPWKFRVAGNTLELFADRRHSLRVVDPKDRELLISCGAALFNLRTAMYHFGCVGDARPLPDPGYPDLLARVTLDSECMLPGEWSKLFTSIPKRATNRGPFEQLELPPAVEHALLEAAHLEGAWLTLFKSTAAKESVAALIAKGDRMQFDNPEFRVELAKWLRSNRDKDGLPGYAKGRSELLDFTTPAIAFLVRTFDLGNGLAARDRQLATGSPLLACLGTARDDTLDWLNAGQALQRVLLIATSHDLHASFLNQPIEVPELRPKLGALTGRKGYPQLLLRIGRGAPAKHTPRRPVWDVLIEDAPTKEPSL
jgi:hypothetical protein